MRPWSSCVWDNIVRAPRSVLPAHAAGSVQHARLPHSLTPHFGMCYFDSEGIFADQAHITCSVSGMSLTGTLHHQPTSCASTGWSVPS